jgi:23S rRNA pseudouridine2605 synthase
MRINKFIAQGTGLSRRAADRAVEEGRVTINGQPASLGDGVNDSDKVTLDGRSITPSVNTITIMLNKPAGYVCSRDGQGSQTIYDLLPAEFLILKPVGRLDKDSSGLLLLTNDGLLANELTHPRYGKEKLYEVELDRPLAEEDLARIQQGVILEDGISKLQVEPHMPSPEKQGSKLQAKNSFHVRMSEGRNRQIRRTFAAIGYEVTKLHRTHFGPYNLTGLASGDLKKLDATQH